MGIGSDELSRVSLAESVDASAVFLRIVGCYLQATQCANLLGLPSCTETSSAERSPLGWRCDTMAGLLLGYRGLLLID